MSKITKADLVSDIAARTGSTIAATKNFVAAFETSVTEHLTAGSDVPLTGFGTFTQKLASERKGRNPQTGAEITVAASRRVGFKVGAELKKAVKAATP